MQHISIESELMALHDRYEAEIRKERDRINAMGNPGERKDQLINQLEREHKEMENLENELNTMDKKAKTGDVNKLYDIVDVLNKAMEKDTSKNLEH